MKRLILIFGLMLFLVGCFNEHYCSFGEWEIVNNPTCTTDGLRRSECSCGEYVEEVIEAIGHKYVNGVLDYNEYGHWVKFDCGCKPSYEDIYEHTIIEGKCWECDFTLDIDADVYFDVSYGDGECEINAIINLNTMDLVIPEEINGCKVTKLGRNLLADYRLNSLTIPKTITTFESNCISYDTCDKIYFAGTLADWMM